MKWWDQMFNTEGVSTTESELNSGTTTTTGPYTPSKSGRLKAIKIVAGYQAATSLVEGGRVRLASAQFGGVDIVVPFQGTGLHTAPADGNPESTNIHECDAPAAAGIPIRGLYMFVDTPTTPTLQVFGLFEG